MREDFKYVRLGYFDQGRISDELVAAFVEEIPGDGVLPPHWRFGSTDDFLSNYGELGDVLWSKSTSSHLLLVRGVRVCRIWTDAANQCWMDVNSSLCTNNVIFVGESIPQGSRQKSGTFTRRVKVTEVEHIKILAEEIKRLYHV